MSVIKTRSPLFIFLFPIFFVLHGFTENYFFVSIKTALLLTIIYIFVSLLLMAIFYLLSKNILAAALMASFVLFIQFFFGYIHDFLKRIAGDNFFSRYSFILLLILTIIIFLFLALKKRKDLARFSKYLNILFLFLIIIDAVMLIKKSVLNYDNISLSEGSLKAKCDKCPQPDIYIIVLDGYAGKEQLETGFDYDNNQFLDKLLEKGVHTFPVTQSNYLFTPYSLASILNGQYIDSTKINGTRKEGIKNMLKYINSNKLISYLKLTGYQFYNFSIFRIAEQNPPVESSLVSTNARLLNENTFLGRFKNEVLINLAKKFGWKKYLQTIMFKTHKDNETLYNLTFDIASIPAKRPKVVFTHLMMPHDPYYFDGRERLRSYQELDSIGIRDKPAYLANLKYSNKKIIGLIDKILTASIQPPVILLISDHGYRYDYENPLSLAFNNLMFAYFPDRNYDNLPDTISAVNIFPLILNKQFGLGLPYRKDSTFTFGF